MTNVWNSISVKVIRAVLFIPVGFTILIILQMLPPFLYIWISLKSVTFTWRSVLIAIFVVPSAMTVYSALVYGATMLTCRIIAPWYRVCTVVFGTLFLVASAMSLIVWYREGHSIWFMIYQIVFNFLVIAGLFGSYSTNKATP